MRGVIDVGSITGEEHLQKKKKKVYKPSRNWLILQWSAIKILRIVYRIMSNKTEPKGNSQSRKTIMWIYSSFSATIGSQCSS